MRLDDGRRGTLRVAPICRDDEECKGPDWESYWLEVRGSRGDVVASQRLWFNYHAYEIVPVDLLGGPGDELLIAGRRAHSSPSTGWGLDIWQIGAPTTEIGPETKIAGSLNWPTCAWWRALLTVNPAEAKPRAIRVTAELSAAPCCRVVERDVAELRRSHTFRFDTKAGRYVVTGPVPDAFRE